MNSAKSPGQISALAVRPPDSVLGSDATPLIADSTPVSTAARGPINCVKANLVGCLRSPGSLLNLRRLTQARQGAMPTQSGIRHMARLLCRVVRCSPSVPARNAPPSKPIIALYFLFSTSSYPDKPESLRSYFIPCIQIALSKRSKNIDLASSYLVIRFSR